MHTAALAICRMPSDAQTKKPVAGVEYVACEMNTTADHAIPSPVLLGEHDNASITCQYQQIVLWYTEHRVPHWCLSDFMVNQRLTYQAMYDLYLADDIPEKFMSCNMDTNTADTLQFREVLWLYCYALLLQEHKTLVALQVSVC
jgi:hypothetical protein